MLSVAQKHIVEQVCQFQIESLETIFMRPYLGLFDEEISYEEFLDLYGCNRKDFDAVTIEVMKIFKKLTEDPELVFKLELSEAIIFRWILFNFRHLWEDQYPKALENLWNKLFLININQLN